MAAESPLKIFHPIQIDNLRRLGNKYDGGYVVHYPSLADADYLVNYGIGYDTAFERDFFKATGKSTLAFDPTLKDFSPIMGKLKRREYVPFLRHLKNYTAWKWRERRLKAYNITYVEEGIAANNANSYKTFAYHFDQHKLDGKQFIFKMDVEGAEYEVFANDSIYSYLRNAIQVIIEFHYLADKIEEAETILKRLSSTHSLIHIHSNNHANFFQYQGRLIPGAIEVTLLSNGYIAYKRYSTAGYPVPGLDHPCDRRQKDEVLDFFY